MAMVSGATAQDSALTYGDVFNERAEVIEDGVAFCKHSPGASQSMGELNIEPHGYSERLVEFCIRPVINTREPGTVFWLFHRVQNCARKEYAIDYFTGAKSWHYMVTATDCNQEGAAFTLHLGAEATAVEIYFSDDASIILQIPSGQ